MSELGLGIRYNPPVLLNFPLSHAFITCSEFAISSEGHGEINLEEKFLLVLMGKIKFNPEER